jgi:hypothetical protein
MQSYSTGGLVKKPFRMLISPRRCGRLALVVRIFPANDITQKKPAIAAFSLAKEKSLAHYLIFFRSEPD